MPPVPITELTSKHKEADQIFTYHVIYSSQQDYNVCIIANDSDVYILSLFVVAYCTGIIYFRQGTQTGKQGITYHNVSLAKELGKEVCDYCQIFMPLLVLITPIHFINNQKYKHLKKPDIKTRYLSKIIIIILFSMYIINHLQSKHPVNVAMLCNINISNSNGNNSNGNSRNGNSNNGNSRNGNSNNGNSNNGNSRNGNSNNGNSNNGNSNNGNSNNGNSSSINTNNGNINNGNSSSINSSNGNSSNGNSSNGNSSNGNSSNGNSSNGNSNNTVWKCGMCGSVACVCVCGVVCVCVWWCVCVCGGVCVCVCVWCVCV